MLIRKNMEHLGSTHIDLPEMALRLFVAAALGAIVGLEREQKEWVAGLRTHILVTLGAALAMMVSTHGFEDVLGEKGFDVDPSRVAAQVVSGVGFLGAGTIIFLKQEVIKGLTTAASIWSLAVVGLAVGGGMYAAAIIATFLILFVLGGIKWIEKKFFSQQRCGTLQFKIKKTELTTIGIIEQLFLQHAIPFDVLAFSTNHADKSHEVTLVFHKKQPRTKIWKALREIGETIEILKVRFSV